MLRSGRQNDRSTLCFELASPLGFDEVGPSKQGWRSAASVAGHKALVIELSLLTAMAGADRRLLSRRHAGEMWFVGERERAGTVPEPIADSAASIPAICEPFGIWVSVKASQA